MMVNGNYNGWRLEDAWLDKWIAPSRVPSNGGQRTAKTEGGEPR